MKRVLLVIFIMIFCPYLVSAEQYPGQESTSEATPLYSLEDLYDIALKRAEKIKISEEDLYISEREKEKALSDLLPALYGFGDYTQYSKKITSREDFLVQPDSTMDWGMRLDYSLSLGGREITAFRISKENILKSTFELDAVKEEYLLEVSTAYYNVLRAQKALEIARQNVKRLTKLRDAAEIRLKVGDATKTVLLRAEAELSGAQSEEIRIENVLKLAKAVLARTVGIAEGYEIREEEALIASYREEAWDFLIEECREQTVYCIKQTAFSERSELKALDMQRKISEDEITYARGLYWPTLSAEGVYERNENDPSRSFEVNERIFAILSLSVPLFEGGLRRAEVREAEAKERQSVLLYEDTKKTINIDVETAYLDFVTQQAVLKSLEDQLVFAGENFNAVEKQFQHGLVDSVDVMDANTLLVTAERELSRTRYNYQLALLKLKWATGTLLKTVLNRKASAE